MRAKTAALSDLSTLQARLLRALDSCATEADIVQVLFQLLRPTFGYDVITLHVLEREGWYHAVGTDEGVLQDRFRGHIAGSVTKPFYQAGKTAVIHDQGPVGATSRGPGIGRHPAGALWVPIRQRGELIASILYQSYEARDAAPEELAFLESLHQHLGVLVANAYLNEVTRDQSVRLAALNAIAKELAATREAGQVLGALDRTLRQLFRVDAVMLATREGRDRPPSLLELGSDGQLREKRLEQDPAGVAVVRTFRNRRSRLELSGGSSQVAVPVREAGRIRAVIAIRADAPDAYESSTVSFLEQIADQVAIALRNSAANTALEAQRRRLEVVNVVGRRLASSLDEWSIARVLREELARHLRFDIFILAIVHDGPEGPTTRGFAYDRGRERSVPPVPLAAAGPSRRAFETGRPVLVTDAPWATGIEARRPRDETWVLDPSAAVFVARSRQKRVVARSLVWVPVRSDERIVALLSLQSYRPDAFGDEEVKLLQDVAAHVGLALTNAEHFGAVQAERRRLEVMAAFTQVDPSEPGPARAQIGGLVERALESWNGALWLYEGGLLTRQGTQEEPEVTGAVPADLTWVPVEVGGAVTGYVVAREPAADAPELPQLMQVLAAQVGMVLARIELIEAKDLMLRAIGHELRSPAAAMRATLETFSDLGDSVAGEQRQVLLAEAYAMSERLLGLVEAQLLVAQLEVGSFRPAPAAVDLGTSVQQVLAILRHRYDHRVTEVQVRVPASLPAAYCEPAHLIQVLANLLGNALEYGLPPVTLRARRVRGWLEVTVSDEGDGVPSERRLSLFEKTARAGRNRRRGGLGLGLYLSRLVVERSFGGRIFVKHGRERGVTFGFTVKAASPEGPAG